MNLFQLQADLETAKLLGDFDRRDELEAQISEVVAAEEAKYQSAMRKIGGAA
jgi:hypothetical protein